jgi:hypothetical protein
MRSIQKQNQCANLTPNALSIASPSFASNRLGELEARDRTKGCGEVKRMTIKPRSGIPSTEIVINDGTGDATVIFSGRRHVVGIEHGHCVIIEGVAFADSNRLVFLNPKYTLLPHGQD